MKKHQVIGLGLMLLSGIFLVSMCAWQAYFPPGLMLALAIVSFLAGLVVYNTKGIHLAKARRVCQQRGHDFHPTHHYPDPKHCKRDLACQRCGETSKDTSPHEIPEDRISYQPGASGCLKIGICKNCGQQVQLATQPHQTIQTQEGCETLEKCKICGDIRVLADTHQWSILKKEFASREYISLDDSYETHHHVTYHCEVCEKTRVSFE